VNSNPADALGLWMFVERAVDSQAMSVGERCCIDSAIARDDLGFITKRARGFSSRRKAQLLFVGRQFDRRVN
jgi:hypothetical protein